MNIKFKVHLYQEERGRVMEKRVMGIMIFVILLVESFAPIRASQIENIQEELAIEESSSESNSSFEEEIVLAATSDSVQIGDEVYVSFDDITGTATISGAGDTWDYLPDGMDQPTGKFKNPFIGKSFSSITIERGVTGLGDYLFYSGGPTDDLYSQSYIKINTIILADTVCSIGEGCFGKVKNLKEIYLPNSMRKIGNYSFMFLNDLEIVELNEGLEVIGDYAFYYTHLKEVIIPSSIINLGAGIFKQCSMLSDVSISSELKVIPDELFEGSAITSFDFDGVEEIGANAFGHSKLNSVHFSKTVNKIGYGAFRDCYNLTEVQIPDTVTSAASYVFANCINLEKISFSSKMSVLSSELLQNCSKITSIVIPDNIKEIQANAFNNCTRLQTVTIPEETEFKWGEEYYSPFEGCNGLIEIIGYTGSSAEKFAAEKGIKFTPIGIKKIKVGENVFATIESDTVVLSGSGTTYDYGYDSEFTWTDHETLQKIKMAIVGEGVTGIGDGFFSVSRNLAEVNLPESLEYIGEYTFAFCDSLKKIDLQTKIVEVGSHAFADSGLQEIVWPSGAKVIEEGTFNGCSNLKKVELPDTVIEIGEYAFSYTGLEELSCPTLVSSIEKSTFEGCEKLEKITFTEQLKEINEQAFMNCMKLSEIFIPKSVSYIGPDTFRNCRELLLQGYKDSLGERYAIANNIQFKSIDYRVVFKDHGKTINKEYVIKGANATPPVIIKKGYILSWDGDYTNVQEDMMINAVWTPEEGISPGPQPPVITPEPEVTKYTVTFVDRGKKIKSEKVIKGGQSEYPYIFRYGYELTWDGDCNNITRNKTITAIWKVISPDKVENLKIFNKGLKVSLSWDESEYASRYQIMRKSAKQKEYEVLGMTGKTVFNDYNTEAGMGYYYKVVASRSVEGKTYDSKESKRVKVLKELKLPSQILIKRITKVSNSTTAQLTMNVSANASGYYVYCYDRKSKKNLLAYKIVGKKVYSYNKSLGKYKLIGNASIKKGKLSCKLTNIDLKKYSSYAYRIRAYNEISGFDNQRTAISEKCYLKR